MSGRACTPLSISDDGRFVLFRDNGAPSADDLGPLTLRDVVADTTVVIAESHWSEAALSGDGAYVVFTAAVPHPVLDPTPADVYVRDVVSGATERLTDDAGSASFSLPTISADGRTVGFQRELRRSTRLVLVDRATGARLRRHLGGALLSADGSTIAFGSRSPNRVARDTNGRADAFVQPTWTRGAYRASFESRGTESDGASWPCAVSADGTVVAFFSTATNLARDHQGGLFVHDRSSGTTTRVASGSVVGCRISGDGRWLTFTTTAALGRGDTNGLDDVYIAGPLRRRAAASSSP